MKKNAKNAKYQKISEFFCLQTQNPRRFPGFAVVVVTFFNEIHDDLHDLFSECVFFQKKKSTTNLGVSLFFKGTVTISVGRETKTHILQKKIVEQLFAKVSSSYNHNHNHNHNHNPNRSNKQTSNQHNHNFLQPQPSDAEGKTPNLMTRGKSTKSANILKERRTRPSTIIATTPQVSNILKFFTAEIEVDS